MRKISIAFFCLLPIFSACKDDAKSTWTEVLSKCAVSDVNGTKMLYFGPSNNLGPGSIWVSDDAEGGYRIRYSLANLPKPQTFVNVGTSFQCSGTSTTTLTGSGSIDAAVSVLPVSADVAVDLKRAKSVTVSVGSASWDDVLGGPYEAYIKALPATNQARVELETGSRLVLIRALKITGFSTKMTFDTNVTPSLKAKYSGPLPTGVSGQLGANLSASWDDSNTLTITSNDDFYIEGKLSQYKTTGLAAAGASPFGNPDGIDIDKRRHALLVKS